MAKRKLLIIDTETGGLDPSVHSILSLAALVVHDGAVEEEMYRLIVEDTILIAENSALAVSGLTLDKVHSEGVSPRQAVNELTAMLQKHDMREGVVLVGHKVEFDARFLRRLYGLAGVDFDAQFTHRMLCTQSTALLLDYAHRINLPGGSASLESVCRYFSVPLDREGGHNALSDARATAQVLRREVRLVQEAR